ncbi:MAG: hypothetical protein RIE73_21240 [Coleofasciculus sp. C1-SOL-03]|uniref:hypothetical protein n=1 Tax=Coleofasciculus sp. C1-SOL-03 TaxID=3069522 RepID=UPI0032FBB8A1
MREIAEYIFYLEGISAYIRQLLNRIEQTQAYDAVGATRLHQLTLPIHSIGSGRPLLKRRMNRKRAIA